MLKTFNSLQIVTVFAAGPFIISWLFAASFAASSIAAWGAVVAYAVLFVLMTIAVNFALDTEW